MTARISLSLAAALTFVAVGVAQGQDAKPAPDCHGFAFTDKAGDQQAGSPVGSLGAGPQNTDVTGGFFLTDDNGTTANIQVSNLDASTASASTGTDWYFVWKAGANTDYVKASVDTGGTF